MKKVVVLALFIIISSLYLTPLLGTASDEGSNEVKIIINSEKSIFNYSERIWIHVRIENHGTRYIQREGYSYTIEISEINGKRNYHLFCYYNASMGTISPGGYFEDRIDILEYSFDERHPGMHLNHLPQGTYKIMAIYGDKDNPWYDSKYIPYKPTYSNSIEITVMGGALNSSPTNLSATLSNYDVTLKWNKPKTDSNCTITRYLIFRGTSPDSLTLIASVNASTTEYVDSNVDKGKTYYYGVSAVSFRGESNLSEIASIEIPKENLDLRWVVLVITVIIIGLIALIAVIEYRKMKENYGG